MYIKFMKIFSNGQFDVESTTYVFDPKTTTFILLRKFAGKKERPSNIFLRYMSRETEDKEIKEFRMFLHDENLEHLKLGDEEVEYEGSIFKHQGLGENAYTFSVNDARKKASEIYKLQRLQIILS